MNTSAMRVRNAYVDYSALLHSLKSSPYSGLERAFLLGPVPEQDRLAPENINMIVYGLLSAVLYFFFFKYQAQIIHFSELVYQGEKIYFAVPIMIALLFSIVHGSFTAYFWESLGLKSKCKE